MTSEGSNWYKCTIPASSAYVMFHNGAGSQEPGNGESGYPVAGETWIQNKGLTFSSKVITSHIDMATGKKISADVTDSQSKTSNSVTYKTSALSGRTDVIAPINATGNYAAGVVNVVYLYGEGGQDETIPTTEPVTTEPVTTAPVKNILIGDVDLDTIISVKDATQLQKHIVNFITLTGDSLIAAECDGDNRLSVKDATVIQKYLIGLSDCGNVGEYTSGGSQDETIPTTEPTTEPVTEPVTTEPVTEPTTTEPVTDPTPTTYTLTFTKPWNGWTDTIYCYSWVSGANGDVAWPGRKMTYSTTNDYGQKLYTVEIPATADYIIFSDSNGTQTVDIPFDGSATRYYTTTTTNGKYNVATW
jgi:hypothetical protein